VNNSEMSANACLLDQNGGRAAGVEPCLASFHSLTERTVRLIVCPILCLFRQVSLLAEGGTLAVGSRGRRASFRLRLSDFGTLSIFAVEEGSRSR
jgi:hypothetical protein